MGGPAVTGYVVLNSEHFGHSQGQLDMLNRRPITGRTGAFKTPNVQSAFPNERVKRVTAEATQTNLVTIDKAAWPTLPIPLRSQNGLVILPLNPVALFPQPHGPELGRWALLVSGIVNPQYFYRARRAGRSVVTTSNFN